MKKFRAWGLVFAAFLWRWKLVIGSLGVALLAVVIWLLPKEPSYGGECQPMVDDLGDDADAAG